MTKPMNFPHITQVPVFLEATNRLSKMLARQAELQAELQALTQGLAAPIARDRAQVEQAILDGQDAPTRTVDIDKARSRYAEVSATLEVITKMIDNQRVAVERAREAARLQALEATAGHLQDLRAAYRRAVEAAARAAAAEDAVLAGLVAKGYGLHEGRICDEPGIDRGALLALLEDIEDVPA